MGLVIKISFGYKWERIYFVQTLDEEEAKEKAFKMFKQLMSCYLPDTLVEANKGEDFYIEVVTTIEQIII